MLWFEVSFRVGFSPRSTHSHCDMNINMLWLGWHSERPMGSWLVAVAHSYEVQSSTSLIVARVVVPYNFIVFNIVIEPHGYIA